MLTCTLMLHADIQSEDNSSHSTSGAEMQSKVSKKENTFKDGKDDYAIMFHNHAHACLQIIKVKIP